MYTVRTEGRICQGDILEDYDYEFSKVTNDELETFSISFPFVVILSQDCDLEQDFKNRNQSPELRENNDKYLQEILFAPAYKAASLRSGDHLKEFKQKMETYNSQRWGFVSSNQNERYHSFPEDAALGIPELVADFKHYYTVPREDMYKIFRSKYRASLVVPYRENLSHRFANYLSRIGLP